MKPRPGLSFETADAQAPQLGRTDVCCFVGAVARRDAAVPAATLRELAARGYAPGRLLGEEAATRLRSLLQLPVLCESFEAFDRLFAWDRRRVLKRAPQPDDPFVTTPLGAALRAFFSEGGRRCYVVRSGDPAPVLAGKLSRLKRVVGSQLRSAHDRPLPLDAREWIGLELVFALDDVSFVCLPDLADACAPLPPTVLLPPETPIAVDEVFRERRPAAQPVVPASGRRLHAPRLDAAARRTWIGLVERARALLDNGGRPFNRADVQLLASLPLSAEREDLPRRADWFERLPFSDAAADGAEQARAAARLQLAYPWLITPESGDSPGAVEAPEGTLAGVLARSGLDKGAFRSAARQRLRRYVDALPALDAETVQRETFLSATAEFTLAERLCLLAPTPQGPALLSDVTAAAHDAWRPASVRRLIGVVLREARRLGDELAFEANGEALWRRLREQLGALGRALAGVGALAIEPGVASFVVRCGRDTMTQSDLDAGRVIAEIELLPARPLERIVVRLALRDGSTGGGRLAA